ncbi:MAG: ORF6N domain-containing protein [Saprospiraceae bacterium]|nr:ORF6N domain-containing protein [Saprospiraceae bacterium]
MNDINTKIVIPDEMVMQKIFSIRGRKVMLDKDLAELYEVETRVLNQAVSRNIERFPEMFMFQLTQNEFEILKSQFVISSWGGTRKLPYAFTEQGVAMLSSVLKSKKAIQVNIKIIMVFTKIREMLIDTLGLKLDIENIKKKLENQNKSIELVFSYLDELIEKQENPKPRKQIGYRISKE